MRWSNRASTDVRRSTVRCTRSARQGRSRPPRRSVPPTARTTSASASSGCADDVLERSMRRLQRAEPHREIVALAREQIGVRLARPLRLAAQREDDGDLFRVETEPAQAADRAELIDGVVLVVAPAAARA